MVPARLRRQRFARRDIGLCLLLLPFAVGGRVADLIAGPPVTKAAADTDATADTNAVAEQGESAGTGASDADAAGPDLSLAGPDLSLAGNEQVAEIMRTFPGRGVQADDSEPTPPHQAVREFRLRDGVQIELMAGEPEVTQPLFVSWDFAGRMWVVQYRQYQYPAGLKVIRYDQHLRAVFDRVPEPPPHGVPGADVITVWEDTTGDGLYDTHRDVIEGLNIATAVEVGRDGIWVLNPPYLLFYPDADGDGRPDGEPEVHLSGFGLQDTHSVANSLKLAPDGWLYGANGSTTTGSISSRVTKGVAFQGQCIWRYHPDTQVFEIYAEGGGNTFSLEIDARGRVFAGTNGGNTRGWYFPQGSYSRKSWGKHGPLTNPYAFGFFEPMRFEGDGRRFPQAFCIYEGGLFADDFEGTIIAPNSLHNLVWHSDRLRDGSTYRTVDRPNLLESADRWFRPVFSAVGPDGGIYLADWYDSRLSHVSPIDDWHKTSGRIYRISPESSAPAYRLGNLREKSSADLISLFDHPNRWVRQRACLELGWRGDRSVTPLLVDRIASSASLESLWALHLIGDLTSERAVAWMGHADPHIRRWVVRLLGDRHEGHPEMAALASREPDVQVRTQLASTAKRIETRHALPIIRGLLAHDEDLRDPHQPLLLWWALEGHADHWDQVERFCADPSVWQSTLMREVLASRLMQRYAAEGTPEDLRRCARLLELAPDEAAVQTLVTGLRRAFEGRTLPPLPDSLGEALDHHRKAQGMDGITLGLRQRSEGVIGEAIGVLSDESADLGARVEIARTLGEARYDQAIRPLVSLAIGRGTREAALQRVAIQSLRSYDDPSIPRAIIGAFGSEISNEHGLRATACRTLASRGEWAMALLAELQQWRLKREDVPADVIQQLRSYDDAEIAAATESVFGPPVGASSEEKQAAMVRLKDALAEAGGSADRGRALYAQRCGKCHQLFGEGAKVGPALDGYERGNLHFWMVGILEPSLEIREGFQSYVALTDDGRVINGMIADQDPRTVTLRNADNQLTVLSREEIDQLKPLPTSLMPEDTLQGLSDDQLRDLFAYLMLGTRDRR